MSTKRAKSLPPIKLAVQLEVHTFSGCDDRLPENAERVGGTLTSFASQKCFCPTPQHLQTEEKRVVGSCTVDVGPVDAIKISCTVSPTITETTAVDVY